jgi:hypothetical protein
VTSDTPCIIIIIIIIIIRKLIDVLVACNRVCELRVEQVKKCFIFHVIRRFIKLSTLADLHVPVLSQIKSIHMLLVFSYRISFSITHLTMRRFYNYHYGRVSSKIFYAFQNFFKDSI